MPGYGWPAFNTASLPSRSAVGRGPAGFRGSIRRVCPINPPVRRASEAGRERMFASRTRSSRGRERLGAVPLRSFCCR